MALSGEPRTHSCQPDDFKLTWPDIRAGPVFLWKQWHCLQTVFVSTMYASLLTNTSQVDLEFPLFSANSAWVLKVLPISNTYCFYKPLLMFLNAVLKIRLHSVISTELSVVKFLVGWSTVYKQTYEICNELSITGLIEFSSISISFIKVTLWVFNNKLYSLVSALVSVTGPINIHFWGPNQLTLLFQRYVKCNRLL